MMSQSLGLSFMDLKPHLLVMLPMRLRYAIVAAMAEIALARDTRHSRH